MSLNPSPLWPPLHPVLQAGALTACHQEWEWNAQPSMMPAFNIWLVLAGSGSLELDGNLYTAGPGDCFLIKRWQETHGRHDPKRPLTVLWMDFNVFDDRGKMLAIDKLQTLPVPATHRLINDTRTLEATMHRCLSAFLRDSDPLTGQTWLRASLCEIASTDNVHQLREQAGSHAEQISQLCQEITEHPEYIWRVEEMSDTLHLSADHYSRLFLHYTGMRPVDFVIARRMEKARAMLAISNSRIGEIADSLGYRDVYHFSSQFRDRTGISPSAYRKRFYSAQAIQTGTHQK